MCECCTPKNVDARESENTVARAAEQSGCGCGCSGACGRGEPGNTNADAHERKTEHTGQPVVTSDTLSV